MRIKLACEKTIGAFRENTGSWLATIVIRCPWYVSPDCMFWVTCTILGENKPRIFILHFEKCKCWSSLWSLLLGYLLTTYLNTWSSIILARTFLQSFSKIKYSRCRNIMAIIQIFFADRLIKPLFAWKSLTQLFHFFL